MDWLDPKTYTAGAAPGDVTLGDMKRYLMKDPVMRPLIAVSKYSDRVRIRYVLVDGLENPIGECLDSMTLLEFRGLVAEGRAIISIDDSDGGVPVRLLEPA